MHEIKWQEWLYAAYHVMGIRPQEFWQLTMPEFMALVRTCGDAVIVTRDELKEMQEKFPDQKSSAEPL